MSTDNHIQDPWVENRVTGHFNDTIDRIDELEERITDLEGSDDELDDNALSRLGLNVAPTPEPESHTVLPHWDGGVIMPNPELLGDLLTVQGDANITGNTTLANINASGMAT